MFSGYTHDSDAAWGNLSANGSFATDDRIGGLTSITYHISADLTVKFGYFEFDKPTFYSAPLSSSLNSFNFPEDKGYPDVFTIENGGENSVTITDMTFYYSCSQQDEHVPVGDGVITREIESGAVKYYQHDQIDTSKKMEVDLSNYIIKLKNSSGTLTDYTPYNYATYDGAGSLDFDYSNLEDSKTKRFILSLDDDYTETPSKRDIYIDSNTAYPSNSQIVIKPSSESTVHDITFKGGYGTLIFKGEKLTLANGTLNSEAKYTSIKSKLSFEDTRRTKDGIYLSNGRLVLENDVTIKGYNRGLFINQGLTEKDVEQSSGKLTINNCNWGVLSDNSKYVATLFIRGTFDISGCRRGIQFCNIEVGSGTKAGNLLINVDKTGSREEEYPDPDTKDESQPDGPSYGIYINRNHTLKFVNGKAAIYSSDKTSYCTAIKATHGFDEEHYEKYHWGDTFTFGIANIRLGFDNSYGHSSDANFNFGDSELNLLQNNFYSVNVGDLAAGCFVKPATKEGVTQELFNATFGI